MEFIENHVAGNQPVLCEHIANDVSTEPTGGERCGQDVCIEKHPHETSRMTSSSVR